MDSGNGNTVLLTVIGVATLLVALVGATFAYFTATVNNDTAQSISVTTATPVGLIYTGTNLELLNAIPGKSAEATFTVQNPADSTTDQTYDLDLIVDTNTFNTTEGAEQLLIVITGEGTVNEVTVASASYDVTDGTTAAKAGTSLDVVTTQRIAVGETQTYRLDLDFAELNKPQDSNQGKSFNAHIEISNPVSVQ